MGAEIQRRSEVHHPNLRCPILSVMQLSSGPGWAAVQCDVSRINELWLSEQSGLVALATADHPSTILLDTTGVAFVDDSFLRVISTLADYCRLNGGRLYVARAPAMLLNLMKGAQLDRSVTLVDDPRFDPTWLSAQTAAVAAHRP